MRLLTGSFSLLSYLFSACFVWSDLALSLKTKACLQFDFHCDSVLQSFKNILQETSIYLSADVSQIFQNKYSTA